MVKANEAHDCVYCGAICDDEYETSVNTFICKSCCEIITKIKLNGKDIFLEDWKTEK